MHKQVFDRATEMISDRLRDQFEAARGAATRREDSLKRPAGPAIRANRQAGPAARHAKGKSMSGDKVAERPARVHSRAELVPTAGFLALLREALNNPDIQFGQPEAPCGGRLLPMLR